MNRKIAIGVVAYRANISLMLRLQNATYAGFKVYLFDNSPEDSSVKDFCKKIDKDLIQYITCGKNLGLGYAISSVCSQAYYDSYPALIFFDQDTIFNLNTLEFIESFYIEHISNINNYSAIVFNSKKITQEITKDEKQFTDILLAISSGSLFLLENLKKINWHNENYFVDCVDYEFCLRSNNNKLKIGEYSRTPGFDHESEQPDRIYKVFGKERLLRQYSRSRVIDAVTASIKLFGDSIKTGNLIFAYAIFRSLIIYVSFQVLIRLIKILKNERK